MKMSDTAFLRNFSWENVVGNVFFQTHEGGRLKHVSG